jgi:polyhydroxybutyrate depolymerase
MRTLGLPSFALLLSTFIVLNLFFASHAAEPRLWSGAKPPTQNEIDIAGVKRSFYLYIPEKAKLPAPTVFVFHGGGGKAEGVDCSVGGMAKLADEEGFIVVYPAGIDKRWNDGRKFEGRKFDGQGKEDDVSFVGELIERLALKKQADPARIYACGISNGGFFSQYLAQQLPGKIAAVASVAASVSEDMANSEVSCEPTMFVLGTKDPLVPFEGGGVGGKLLKSGRGSVLPFADSINFWCKANCADKLTFDQMLPDTVTSDRCQVEVMRYGSVGSQAEVLVYKIIGGGHTWPQGLQYLPKALVGIVCRDFNCNEAIWKFFSTHCR